MEAQPDGLTFSRRWYDYSRARDMMMAATDTDAEPWHIVSADDKRRARLNCISHLLSLIPYKKVHKKTVKLPKLSAGTREAVLFSKRFAQIANLSS